MKKIFSAVVLCVVAISSIRAQKTDSVIINVGEKSKVIFAIGDKADLQTLKQYNFQAVVDDLVSKLEQQDSSKLDKPADTYLKIEEPQTAQPDEVTTTREYRDRDRNDDDWNRSWDDRRSNNDRRYNGTVSHYYGRRTRHSFNFDIGTNNFLTPTNGLPDYTPYAVRPWGSWYVAINSLE